MSCIDLGFHIAVALVELADGVADAFELLKVHQCAAHSPAVEEHELCVTANNENTYLGDFAELMNDLSIAVDDLFLKIQPKLATVLCYILQPSLI